MEFLLEKLDEIWNVYGSDKVGKGGAFERLMASYLRTAPEFSDRFDEVYLWQDWPERGAMHDHGIDIVAKDLHTGGWCAVQCKFYNPQHHVSKADIDSFLAASAKKQFTGRIIVSTAKDWGPTAESQLDGLTVPVTRIGVNDLLESQVDWSQIDWQEPQTYLPLTGKKQLRPHQSAAKDAAVTGLATHRRLQGVDHGRGREAGQTLPGLDQRIRLRGGRVGLLRRGRCGNQLVVGGVGRRRGGRRRELAGRRWRKPGVGRALPRRGRDLQLGDAFLLGFEETLGLVEETGVL